MEKRQLVLTPANPGSTILFARNNARLPEIIRQDINKQHARNSRGGEIMIETVRIKYLKIALLLVGLVFLAGVYPLTIVWPTGWSWHAGQSVYLQMILGIYATLGVFLIIASRDPLAHRSLIWFTVWSSVVHGGIMAAQALVYPEHIGHLLGDVPALLIVAAVLGLLMPRARKAANG
jgi:FtsH-binding integral membrane protein